ncbi:MAG: YCF48-related protein [Candidatus Kapaibacterium sp.]
MKTTVLLFFATVFGFLFAPHVFSQGLNSISASNPQNVMAVGNNGKILRTSSGGTGWSLHVLNNTVNYKSVSAAGNYYFLSASNGKVYKTSVNVLSLSEQNTGVATPLNSVSFLDSLNGFACGANGAVIKTTNGGTNWTSVNSGIGSFNLNSVSFKDLNNGIVVGESGRVYLTTNGGNIWFLQSSLTNRNLLQAKYYNRGIVIVGEYGVIIKKDSTNSFYSLNSKTNSDIRSISGTYEINHICGGGGFIRNNKNGSDGYLNFEINPMMANLVDIVYADTLSGYAISSLNDAVIKTTNGGESWSLPVGTSVNISWVSKLTASSGIGNNLCQHPFDRNAMYVMYGSTVYVSRNRGETWSSIATTSLGSRAHSFYVSPLDTNVWVAAVESSPDKVIKSTNYGVTWTTIISKNFSNYGQPLEMDQNNPSVFYFAPDGGGFYKSLDTGSTFTEISGNYPFRSPCDLIVMYDSSKIVFVADGVTGSGVAKIFKSTNGGINWLDVHTNPSASEIPSMSNVVFDKSVIYATNWPSGAIYRTTNFGDNWSLLRTNSGSGWASDVCREDPTLVLTGSYGSSSWLSTDGGANFSTHSVTGGAGAGMIVPERGYQLNMMTGGLSKMTYIYSVLTDVEENNVTSLVPDKFKLHQNYPNPFNPITRIKFDLPKSSNVKIVLYDNVGRELKTILNEYRNAGTYEINFDGSRLSTGVYYYRLTSGSISETKKMILTK